MITFVSRSAKRMGCVGVLFAAAAGIAYAAIPGSGGTYTGCMLNKVGTVRLIDASLPASNLMSHCTSAETKFTFNQQGQQGSPGMPGKDGVNGKDGTSGTDGVSPTVTQLAVGDTHCGGGGAAVTDAGGGQAYVCNGTDGIDGQPFSGTFASLNGQFSITVDDNGITVAGPDNSIKLDDSGAIKAVAASSFDLMAGGATTLVSGSTLNLKSGSAATVDVGGALSLKTAQAATVIVGTSLNANVGGAANLIANSLDLKATGTAILEAGGPLSLRGTVINEN
jgi:hypothetical protein